MWKAGQCVTIDGKTYRVTKLKNTNLGECIFCEFKHREPDVYPCDRCGQLIPKNCYFKRVCMERDLSNDLIELTDEDIKKDLDFIETMEELGLS